MNTIERPARAQTAAADGPPRQAPAVIPAVRLLQFEAEIRRQPSEAALLFHLANETGSLVPCHQVWVWRRQRGSGDAQAGQHRQAGHLADTGGGRSIQRGGAGRRGRRLG